MCASRIWFVITFISRSRSSDASREERGRVVFQADTHLTFLSLVAEFRGPGIHHIEDSGDDYDMDMDHRTANLGGGKSGRIILLGDGTEVLTDSTDGDMFDDAEEKDLESQVNKGQAAAAEERGQREATPAPASGSKPDTPDKATTDTPQQKPASS